MTEFPTLFVSHGAPNMILHNVPARDFLSRYGDELGRPEAVLVVSAHFETSAPALTTDPNPKMIYDFTGFEPELYEMTYPAPGAPDLAGRAADLLAAAGFPAVPARNRGFDHGAWVPLKLLYPKADVPVVELSVQPRRDAEHHVRVGRAIAPLRRDGVLIVGSGVLTHNLGEMRRGEYAEDAPAPDWVVAFGDWMHEKIEAGAIDELAAYRDKAPHAEKNHPTEEHILPLFTALGAAGVAARGKRVHSSHSLGVLQMDAYAFA
ncbi:MAG: class III extradiol ring-cleavage dioxygenase [Hyphomicrobiales bacterium]|nr:class III extradiol ring-cleavage dioxygenase [Hyphomicrobiales bacterium]